MGYPYHFVDVNAEQVARIRQLLDSYGQFAQLSVLLIPLLFQLSSGVYLIYKRLSPSWSSDQKKERRSPATSPRQTDDYFDQRSGWNWAKVRWTLDEEIVAGWGTWKQWIFAMTWACWLLLLVTMNTGDNYLHVTRRFGIVAASQLPIHYLLAVKSWSPVQYITRLSHEELNSYHRALGRIIVSLLACHGFLYLNFYVQKGFLAKRLKDRDVILGLSALSAFSLLLTSAIARVRRYNYRVFLALHVLLSLAVIPILYFHVSHIRVYIIEALAVFAFIVLQRKMSQTTVSAKISPIEGTELLSIIVDVSKLKSKRQFAPGSHLYIKFDQMENPVRNNPFTIARTPKDRQELQLVIRELSGTTALIRPFTKSPQPVPVTIEGPYGAANYFPDFKDYNDILLVAGGVGATFTMPIYQHLLANNTHVGKTPNLRFVWSVRDEREAHWGMDMLSKDGAPLPASFELYITGRRGANKPSKASKHNDASDEIELEEREGLLAESDDRPSSHLAMANGRENFKNGRPPLHALVDQFFSGAQGTKFGVLVCGPKGMGSALRKEVGRFVTNDKQIFWHNEEFGW